FRQQVLGLALRVVGDQPRRRRQDRLRAAVVQAQRQDAGAGEVALEVENISNIGSSKSVNRLVRVSDDAQVGEIDGQPASDLVLRLVGVLVLVDEDVLEAGVEFAAQLLVVLQRQGRPVQQVVEIDGVGLVQAFLVDGV